MRNISNTITRLAAFRQNQANFLRKASFGRLSVLPRFGSNPGGLTGRFYVPQDLPAAAPLVVVLHGCTQTADDYDNRSGWSQLADEAGFALLYPEQSGANNANLCFNWFSPPDVRRGSGEALSIRQMIEAMLVQHDLDRDRVFVTGLSAGGAMACAMLATYPELFAGGAIIAGLAYGRATTMPEAFDRMRGHGAASDEELHGLLRGASSHTGDWPRLSIWQGSADATVVPSNADEIATQWRSVHGAGEAPTRSDTAGARIKRTWCNAAGEVVIELNTVAAMGHGTPLGDGLGVPGPFMLDVGISSTREIAHFWKIAKPVSQKQFGERPMSALDPAAPAPFGAAAGGAPARRPLMLPAVNTFGVAKIIDNVLRASGLMR